MKESKRKMACVCLCVRVDLVLCEIESLLLGRAQFRRRRSEESTADTGSYAGELFFLGKSRSK
jgi:hypothetical protein